MNRAFACAVAVLLAGTVFAQPKKPVKLPPLPAVPAALQPLKAGFRYIGNQPDALMLTLTADDPLTAEQWAAVEALPIKYFSGSGKGMDDAALARLAKRPLVGLTLQHPSATDAGAAAFAGMKDLKSFTLIHASKMTGKGAAALANHPALENAAGDEGFFAGGTAHLTTCPKLKAVRLYHGFVTDDTVKPLAGNTTIETLNLWPLLRAGISDESFPVLATMTGLKDLTIGQTVVTLDGLRKLKALPNLARLALMEVALAPANVEALKAELPKVRITFTPMPAEYRVQWEAFAKKQNHPAAKK